MMNHKSVWSSDLLCLKDDVAVSKQGSAKFINFTRPLTFQTPVLLSKTGFRVFNETSMPSLLLSLEGHDDEHTSFRSLLLSVDDSIIDSIMTRSAQWIGKPITVSRDMFVDTSYNNIVRQVEQYPASISLRMKFTNTNVPLFSIFDQNKERVTFDSRDDLQRILHKGVHVKAIFSCQSIYYINKRFGVSLDLISLKLHDDETSPTITYDQYMFDDEI